MDLLNDLGTRLGAVPWAAWADRAIRWAIIAAVVLAGAWVAWRVVLRLVRQQSYSSLMTEHGGFDDRLVGETASFLFDSGESLLGVATPRVRRVLPYALIRKWRADPVYDRKGKRRGWDFIVETGDPREPIWTVRLPRGATQATANYWMAKFSAHLNG